MKNVDIFLNTGIFSRSVANRINFYDWSKVKNFPKKGRKKSLSSCYGYIDLIAIKILLRVEKIFFLYEISSAVILQIFRIL